MLKVIKENRDFLSLPGPWSIVYCTYPISIPLAKRLAKTRIKPNQITFFSGMLAIIAAFLFYLGTPLYLALGGIVFYLGFVLDQTDGNLARITNQESEFGRKFDLLVDSFRKVICFIPLLYSQFYAKGGLELLALGVGLILFHYGMHFAYNFLTQRGFQSPQFLRRLSPKEDISKPFGKADEQFLIFVIGPLLNKFVIFFIVAVGLFFVLEVLFRIIPFRSKGG